MNVKFHKNCDYTVKILKISCVRFKFCEIWHSYIFSGSHENFFFWCHYRWFITSLALEKCKRECNILWIILVQDFCPLKIKITHSPIPGKSFQTLRETCFECTQNVSFSVSLPEHLIWQNLCCHKTGLSH